jgi:predicted transcriptional regulator
LEEFHFEKEKKVKNCLLLCILVPLIAFALTGCQQSAAQTDAQLIAVEEPSSTTEPVSPKPKPRRPAPSQNVHKMSWEEKCSVEQAFSASMQTLGKLELATDLDRTRNIRVRNPRTGRIGNTQVSTNRDARSDGLSATLKGRSTANVDFHITILLMPPESCRILIMATSPNQPEDVLEQHSHFLKQKISEAIQNPEAEVANEPVPYPQTMVFERSVDQVYSAIRHGWAEKERFEFDGDGRDRYYKVIDCTCGSNIKLKFTMHLIDTNKTKLEIEASNYEEKEEFNMIIQRLTDTLQTLKEEQADSQQGYTETMTLDHSVAAVHDALIGWVKSSNFTTSRNSGGDQFYRYFSFTTGSRIEFYFQMRLVDTNKTQLKMTISQQEDKEEFPMILKSLQEALERIGENQSEAVGASATASGRIQKRESCQSE